MADHLRFSVVFWHTMRGSGSDMFGWGTAIRPWELGEGTVADALTQTPLNTPGVLSPGARRFAASMGAELLEGAPGIQARLEYQLDVR